MYYVFFFNFRCYVRLDIIRRILVNYFHLNVFMMMGITDIDDKIIARSAQQKEHFRLLADRYEKEFFQDMSQLNVIEPSVTARVSDHITDIILFVKQILDKELAYVSKQGIVIVFSCSCIHWKLFMECYFCSLIIICVCILC